MCTLFRESRACAAFFLFLASFVCAFACRSFFLLLLFNKTGPELRCGWCLNRLIRAALLCVASRFLSSCGRMSIDLSAGLVEVSKTGDDAAQAVAKFAHRAIDDLCGRAVNFSKEYKSVTHAHDVASVLQDGIRTFFGKQLKEPELLAFFTEQQNVPSKVAKVLVSAVISRQAEIKKQLVEHLVNISSSHMTDFDWSLQLTMATSHLSQVRACYLTMRKLTATQ